MEAAESGKLVSVPNPEQFEAEVLEVIKNTFEKKKKITINLFENDILVIKKQALKAGIPYQTYISSLIHKHAVKI
jgi:predicted DNA binding CopG/RHH family protein